MVAEIFAIKVGSCVKSAQIFVYFWPQKGPEFLDLHYKTTSDDTDDMAKMAIWESNDHATDDVT